MRRSVTLYWHTCDMPSCGRRSQSEDSPESASASARHEGFLIAADYELCSKHRGVAAEEAVAAGKHARIDGAEADCG